MNNRNFCAIGQLNQTANIAGRQYLGIAGLQNFIDAALPAQWAARTLQPHCAVQGNLDPLCLLAGGARMIEETRAILEALAGGPFIFNLGHGIVPATPPEHVARLVEFVRGWRS